MTRNVCDQLSNEISQYAVLLTEKVSSIPVIPKKNQASEFTSALALWRRRQPLSLWNIRRAREREDRHTKLSFLLICFIFQHSSTKANLRVGKRSGVAGHSIFSHFFDKPASTLLGTQEWSIHPNHSLKNASVSRPYCECDTCHMIHTLRRPYPVHCEPASAIIATQERSPYSTVTSQEKRAFHGEPFVSRPMLSGRDL